MMEGNEHLPNLDDKKRIKMDSSSQETTPSDEVPTHPAVLAVFRTDNILEEICSHLGWNDLKQFRLVSRACNSEGRRALMKQDRHWVVVSSKNYVWQLKLDRILTRLEDTTSAGGENWNKKLLGWIFQRLELEDWKHSFGHQYFLQQWGHYLRKIHLKTKDYEDEATCQNVPTFNFNIFHFINTVHQLLTVCCPNLDEMVAETDHLYGVFSSPLAMNQSASLEFPSPLLKLKCLQLRYSTISSRSNEEIEVLPGFLTKLVRAAGTALETLEIDHGDGLVEGRMLRSLALNVGVSNFQSLKEITLGSDGHVGNLSHTVQKCFPELTKLILRCFNSAPIVTLRPESFPALKSLTIHYISYRNITDGSILQLLQHFPNLEVLVISSFSGGRRTDGFITIINPIAPVLKSLQSFTFETDEYHLGLLRCGVNMFPNLITLNLLGFGLIGGQFRGGAIPEPEYGFGQLIDIISPLRRLQHLYVNHAFHTSPQLVDAIKLTSNLTALQTIIVYQAAHSNMQLFNDIVGLDFKVSLYLTPSDQEFQYILDCDSVTRLKSVQLLGFRYGTTEEELKLDAAAKGGHVSFGTICP